MRKSTTSLLSAAALAALLSSCLAGPHQLTRTVDDWDRKLYVGSPRFNAVLHALPVIPLAKAGAMLADFFVTDAIAFWGHDLWDNRGTGFVHYEVDGDDGTVSSLLYEGAGWLRVNR